MLAVSSEATSTWKLSSIDTTGILSSVTLENTLEIDRTVEATSPIKSVDIDINRSDQVVAVWEENHTGGGYKGQILIQKFSVIDYVIGEVTAPIQLTLNDSGQDSDYNNTAPKISIGPDGMTHIVFVRNQILDTYVGEIRHIVVDENNNIVSETTITDASIGRNKGATEGAIGDTYEPYLTEEQFKDHETPSIAVNHFGHIYIAWSATRDAVSNDNTDILVYSSLQKEATGFDVIALRMENTQGDSEAYDPADNKSPAICVDDIGNAFVLFYRKNPFADAGEKAELVLCKLRQPTISVHRTPDSYLYHPIGDDAKIIVVLGSDDDSIFHQKDLIIDRSGSLYIASLEEASPSGFHSLKYTTTSLEEQIKERKGFSTLATALVPDSQDSTTLISTSKLSNVSQKRNPVYIAASDSKPGFASYGLPQIIAEAAKFGVPVILSSGTYSYTGSIKITEGVTIQGNGAVLKPFFDSGNSGPAIDLTGSLAAPDVYDSEFKFSLQTPGGSVNPSLIAKKGDTFIVVDNEQTKVIGETIVTNLDSSTVTIEDSIDSFGVPREDISLIFSVSNVQMDNLTIESNDGDREFLGCYGIYNCSFKGLTFKRTVSEGTSYPISIEFARSCSFSTNRIVGGGGASGQYAVDVKYANNCEINWNVIKNCSSSAVYVHSSSTDNTLKGNSSIGNLIGGGDYDYTIDGNDNILEYNIGKVSMVGTPPSYEVHSNAALSKYKNVDVESALTADSLVADTVDATTTTSESYEFSDSKQFKQFLSPVHVVTPGGLSVNDEMWDTTLESSQVDVIASAGGQAQIRSRDTIHLVPGTSGRFIRIESSLYQVKEVIYHETNVEFQALLSLVSGSDVAVQDDVTAYLIYHRRPITGLFDVSGYKDAVERYRSESVSYVKRDYMPTFFYAVAAIVTNEPDDFNKMVACIPIPQSMYNMSGWELESINIIGLIRNASLSCYTMKLSCLVIRSGMSGEDVAETEKPTYTTFDTADREFDPTDGGQYVEANLNISLNNTKVMTSDETMAVVYCESIETGTFLDFEYIIRNIELNYKRTTSAVI